MSWSLQPGGQQLPRNILNQLPRARRRFLHHSVLAALCAVLLPGVYSLTQADASNARWSLASAYVSMMLLGVTLMVGAINLLRGRRNPVSSDLRRDIGIWCGMIGLLHVVIGLQVHMGSMLLYFFREAGGAKKLALRFDLFGFANYTGLLATMIVAMLLATSNDVSYRTLGSRAWKSLHRWNYALIALVIVHGVAYQVMEHRRAPWLVLFAAIAAIVGVLQMAGYRQRKVAGRPSDRQGLPPDIPSA